MTASIATILWPVVISFAVSTALGPVIIPFLRKLKFGQTIRDEGPESHKKKNGTPTMGGMIFLAGICAACIFFAKSCPKIIPVLWLTLGFGLVGFLDDYIKVVLKRSLGLRAWQKMLCQLVVTGIFAYYLVAVLDMDLAMKVPFFSDLTVNLGILNIPFMFCVVLGTVNGTNFTDGVDGLASSVTSVIAAFLAIVSIGVNAGIEPIAAAMLGGLMGFLVYNLHPAKVFMGDTGSLALGGFVAGCAYMLKIPLFIPIFGIIYAVEVLSVMLQVGYFKLTHGKRIFRMAPIHHHYELGGWSETKVVGVFTIVTVLACLIAYAAL